MGCDLHITRRQNWADKGADITAEEWLAYVRHDSELRLQPENGCCFAMWHGAASQRNDSWLDWSDGQIYAKNPDAALTDKMVAMARQLGAAVQGDDGEIYEGSTQSPRQPVLSLGARVTGWFKRASTPSQAMVGHPPLPFGVGDKVRDTFGCRHTVISIDPKAEHGLGMIRTRGDDGTEHAFAMIAHGLTPDAKQDTP